MMKISALNKTSLFKCFELICFVALLTRYFIGINIGCFHAICSPSNSGKIIRTLNKTHGNGDDMRACVLKKGPPIKYISSMVDVIGLGRRKWHKETTRTINSFRNILCSIGKINKQIKNKKKSSKKKRWFSFSHSKCQLYKKHDIKKI